MDTKPEVDVNKGVNGNIYSVLTAAARALRDAKADRDTIESLKRRVMQAKSYDSALGIIMEYVELT